MSLDFFFVFVVVVRVEPWQRKIATSSYISCFCVDLNQVSELPFQPSFCGESEDACKAPKAQNRSEKLGSWKGPKNHNSFLAYKTSGFVRWPKTLETEEAGTSKVYKKRPSILNPNWGLARQKRQNTLRFKRIFRKSDIPRNLWSKK